jgi:5'-methylthioadenosine phosphorylase
MTDSIVLGVLGGSGLYHMPGLSEIEERVIETPFGPPSDPVVIGRLGGKQVAFLARHGRGHRYTPTEVNYRANLWAFKSLGIERVVAVSACGSLRDDYAPGHIVIPDQLYDRTTSRPRSFFGDGWVAHVSVADPYCQQLSGLAYQAVAATGATVHRGGTFVTIEGPRFSTKAESHTYRRLGFDLIGMTTSPEAFLAREAELCYAVIAHVTDYDVWHTSAEPVTVEMVIRTLNENTAHAQQALTKLVESLDGTTRDCPCSSALKDALMTAPDRIPRATRDRLALLTHKYLKP